MLEKAVQNVYIVKPNCLFRTMSQISSSVCLPQNAENDIENDVHLKQGSATMLEAETVINTNNSSAQVEVPEDLRDLLTDDYCHICEAVLLFEAQRTSHYKGKKHAQKLRLYRLSKKAETPDKDATVLQAGSSVDKDKFCELCNMVFSSPVVAKSHYEGKTHAKNARRCRPLDAKLKVECAQPSSPQIADESEEEGEDTATVGFQVPAATATATTTTSDASPTTTQEVDLSDPNKHCRMCAATFNNPTMAQQHYSGRKHQRKRSHQQLMQELCEDGEIVGSLTCAICSVDFCSVEMYQSHMQGNKHQIKEKKVVDLCKSQKKVYESFQDELADYIEVQKARGLQPKAVESAPDREEDKVPPPSSPQPPPSPPPPPPPPPPSSSSLPPSLFSVPFPPPNVAHPSFPPPANHFAAWVRGIPPHHLPPFWEPGYNNQSQPSPVPYALPQGPVGRWPARGRSPDWWSSSSAPSSSTDFSDSGSSSNSISSSDCDDSREKRRRRKRKLKGRDKKDRRKEERVKEERVKEERVKEERADHRRPRKREREKREEHGEKRSRRRKEREKRPRTEASSEDKRQRRAEKHHRRPHEEEENWEGAKRRREAHEDLGTCEGENMAGHVREKAGEESHGRQENVALMESHPEEPSDKHKHRHKKEKKRKEKTEVVDTRTEEEKLWDATIVSSY